MNRIRDSVFAYFALVFALSIPFWVLDMVYPIELMPGLPVSALGAFVPALSASILTYRNGGLADVFQLLGRSFDFRRIKSAIWYLAAIVINPAIAVLAYGIMRASDSSLPAPAPLSLTILPMLGIFFIAALAEELGWAGYATEPLQNRWGPLTAGIVLGLVWAVWHFVPLVQAHRSAEWIAWWSLGTIALRMIMTWLYFHSGKSVFAAAVFHAMINLCWQLFPLNGSYYDPKVFGLITLGLAAAIFTLEWLMGRSRAHDS